MQFTSKRIRSGAILLPLFIALGFYSIHEAGANPGGYVGVSKTGCGGPGCHGTKSTETSVTITTDASEIVAGQTYVFQISVSNASEVSGGCDISVDKGKLAVNGTGSTALQFASNELTHRTPKAFSNDTATWKFKYTAPSTPGVAHIYAAGNAVNGNGREDANDHWNTVAYTVNVVAGSTGPHISITKPTVFSAMVADSQSQRITVKNTGTSTINISSYSLTTGSVFKIVDKGKLIVPGGDSSFVRVTFKPTATGAASDGLRIQSDDGTTPDTTIALNGTGLAPGPNVLQTTPNPLSFGQVKVGTTVTRTIVLRDTGTMPLNITSATVTGAFTNAFALVGLNPAAPIVLQPHDSTVATITFTPDNAAALSGVLMIFFNGGTDNSISVELSGEGTLDASVDNGLAQADVRISPNPSTTGQFLISNPSAPSAEIEVTDAAGKVVYRTNEKLQPESMLDLSFLSSGTYFLRLEPRDGMVYVRRIVIER